MPLRCTAGAQDQNIWHVFQFQALRFILQITHQANTISVVAKKLVPILEDECVYGARVTEARSLISPTRLDHLTSCGAM